MKEKLRILMQNENLTASKLAEILNIKPAGISHILSGRNNPSYELVCKIVNCFPHINPYWLLGDSEKMYNDTEGVASTQTKTNPKTKIPENGLFDFDKMTTHPQSEGSAIGTAVPPQRTAEQLPVSGYTGQSSDIVRVIVTYNDGSFESFTPRK